MLFNYKLYKTYQQNCVWCKCRNKKNRGTRNMFEKLNIHEVCLKITK